MALSYWISIMVVRHSKMFLNDPKKTAPKLNHRTKVQLRKMNIAGQKSTHWLALALKQLVKVSFAKLLAECVQYSRKRFA